ncbi:2,4-dienoyl-CoA reductase-like NADH-dependent reductase (Old Yellow Enzyme family) [Alkalihalobacillus xiaoxiensis]|uniref:2,4-dienoyl-CoA reductase-like NADH-dependent reductase (Old Yellow Enzyme family) n=1 Tax=Shouchella xiaoxiensis TaxID=766895 RepID=A0ABS2SXL0_9BACI|nr:NADH:flavin oxidoreductase/NADH oxidase [Shouchella xiaoxiensis]MBM7840273.1 2,4-dienoyl-CoA reductase-like NADH-dependent reductase (Old Yellow Enzyme family) [Shouchella xiaoxiensis]
MANLMEPIQLNQLRLKNRVVMSPMCQYSAAGKDGIVTDWHLHHYTSRAIGGVGLILMEMTNVDPDGRISDFCLGLWSDEQRDALIPIVEQAHQHGAKIGIQIAHAGRKAEDAANPVSSSAVAFSSAYKEPKELSETEITTLVDQYKQAAKRAVEAGFDTIELHGAHGYLIHQFLSPFSNKRTDRYGEDRTLFAKEIIHAVKTVIPKEMPLIMRISATEYVEEGYTVEEAIAFSRELVQAGVDVLDVSSGGEGKPDPGRFPGTFGGYQVPLARKLKEALNIPVIAVGMLDNPVLANSVLQNGDADLIAIGRGLLSNPYWTLSAAETLKLEKDVPKQYQQAQF